MDWLLVVGFNLSNLVTDYFCCCTLYFTVSFLIADSGVVLVLLVSPPPPGICLHSHIGIHGSLRLAFSFMRVET